MTDPTLTDITMLLDRSGSMQSIKDDTVGGFAAFIERQRTQPGTCRVTLAQFDDWYDVVYTARDVADVPPMDLVPRGSTVLLDAIGRVVAETGERMSATPEAERPGAVIVGIMTDGMENASRECTADVIRTVITRQEEQDGRTFLYLGADQDAITVGGRMELPADRSMTYSPGRAAAAWAARSAASFTEGPAP
ncbi:vWA domain-containing protein [Nakamurella leprariae]|uniref:VWA domain-containing protein n=1 Tax=Nakamurella leprariae TaxID=2803911 RepID=A0A938YFK0_9ACTN|nr:vWA domain-containing protein [Nakamurella leprariae]MBM9468658.1 VWA domain-containing protein [Nakamurella leprariae]